MVKFNPSLEMAPTFDHIKAVVMDIDGVLIDVTMYEFLQSVHMMGYYNKLPTDQDEVTFLSGSQILDHITDAFRGSSGDPTKYYQLLLGREDLGPEFPILHRHGVEQYKMTVAPTRGALAFLGELAASDKAAAYWTSRDTDLVNRELLPWLLPLPDDLEVDRRPYRRHGFVDRIITADDVGVDNTGQRKMKPNPAGLQLLSDEFHVPPTDMVVIGDRLSDIIPAKKLGALAIGVKTMYIHETEYWDAGADALVNDMEDAATLIFPR